MHIVMDMEKYIIFEAVLIAMNVSSLLSFKSCFTVHRNTKKCNSFKRKTVAFLLKLLI